MCNFVLHANTFLSIMESIQSQDQWVLYRLEKFYSKSENIERVSKILQGESTLSLRLIDWFVTNYAKKYNTSYMHGSRHIIVYLSYKSHLKAYSKKMFDPFCRSKRIKFSGFDTTVGQLNFFEWAITDGILDFIENNYEAVHNDMDIRLKDNEKFPDRKRHELSKSATNSLKRHDIHILVRFE